MINQAGIAIIKEFEGFRAKAYLDELAKPPVWTIGYGTTERAGVGISPSAGMVITESKAAEYLQITVNKFAAQVMKMLTRKATGNQLAAMVSLAYNIGPGAFFKSTVLRQFNAGNEQAAADAFLMWNKAGGKVYRGLVRRREAERALFLQDDVKETPKNEHVKRDVLAKPGFISALIAAIIRLFGGKK